MQADENPAPEYVSDRHRFRLAAVESHAASRETGPVIIKGAVSRTGQRRRPITECPVLMLTRLRDGHRRRIPVYIQAQVVDCGPICLAMVLGYHGLQASVNQLREEANTGRDGVSARTLLAVARRHGLFGRGVNCGIGELQHLERGSILFWNFNHFVVLDRATRAHVDVIDPAVGRRRLSYDAVSDAFTGVALEFQPPLRQQGNVNLPHESFRQRYARSPWHYLTFFLPAGRPWRPLVGASLLLLLFNFVMPLAFAYVVEDVHYGAALPHAARLAGEIAGIAVAFFALQVGRAKAIATLQSIADTRVTVGVLTHLLSLPYDFFARRNPGDLAMRVRTSLAVRRVLTGSAISALFDGLLVLAYGALLVLADPSLAGVVLILALAQIAVMLAAWRGQLRLTTETLDRQSRSEGELVEILEGISTLKAAGLDGTAGTRWSQTFADEVNARSRSSRHLAFWTAFGAGIQFLAPLSVLFVGMIQVSDRDASLAKIVAFSTLAMSLFLPLTNLVLTGMQIAGLGRTLTRLGDILEAVPENNILFPLIIPGSLGRMVEVRHVSFTYPGAQVDTLHDISFTVEPGDFLAILGESGSGKSTLAAVIAALYLPKEGEVCFDGLPTSQVDRTSLRRAISFVDQNSRLFAGSIHDNIAFGRPGISREDVIAGAKVAHVHDDIAALPMGYETLIGPGGTGLSGGQRQRVALARALVKQPLLLVLDEATSALDPATEDRVFRSLLSLDCTLIVIAHRLTVMAQASQIVVLKHGKVAAHGKYDQLKAADVIA
jgi:ATP-binding cassette, subfamily B, bacterial